MKKKVFAVFTVVLLFALAFPFSAESTQDIIKRQKEDYGIDKIENEVPQSAKENASEYGNLTVDESASLLDVKTVFSFCIKSLLTVFKGKSVMLVELFSLAFLMWLFNTLSEKDKSPEILKILNYVTIAAAAVIFFQSVLSSSQSLSSSCGELLVFLSSMLPVLLAVTAAGGSALTASSVGATAAFGLQSVGFLINSFILPFTSLYLTLGVASGLTDSVNLKRISRSVKNTVIGAFGFFFCVFSVIMTSQKYFALAGDSLSRKTIKLAAGSFLPLAGAGISEGVDTAFACAAVLRGSVGLFGVAVLFFTLIPPIIDIFANLVLISLASAVCGFFENETLSSFFATVRDVFMILLTVASLSALIILVSLAVLVRI